MYYFSSDTHFGDEQTLKVDCRPFKTVKQFDKFVIKTWNKQAKKGDTIFVVGDFVDCDGPNSEGWRESIKYVKKIKAQVVLILGNNEERIIKFFFDDNFEAFKKFAIETGFKDVVKNLEIEFKGKKFYLVHKPVDHKEGVINLFGHIHRSTGIYREFGFNVGCDLNHFRLYSEDDIFHLMDMKEKFWDKDKNINKSDGETKKSDKKYSKV